VSTELFPEFCYTRRDHDDPATVDRRPPLPPPRRPPPAPRSVLDKSSPPPPPATTATASIEDVIGRLRLDEIRKTSMVAGDSSTGRRVPRMGTRLCSDPVPARTAVVSELATTEDLTIDDDRLGSPLWRELAVPPNATSVPLKSSEFTLEDRIASPLWREAVTPPKTTSVPLRTVDEPQIDSLLSTASPLLALDVGGCCGSVDRRPGVSRHTQTDTNPPGAELESHRGVCADVMYTNRANLRHTIAVQQRLFRQQLAERAQQGPSDDRSPPDRSSPVPVETATRPAAKLEWIVRKRSDGSRYVTRRPVRSVVRRAAAAWVGDATTTTDEEEVEQPKTGRYWTRDQRRQHVAERRRRDAMKQMKRSAANNNSSSPGRTEQGLTAELAAIGRHRQIPLLSVATV